MSVNVNWADVAMGLIVLGLAALAAVTYFFLERMRLTLADRRQREAFEQDMKDAGRPDYDGETYEWDAQTLAYLNDTHVYAGPGVAETAEFPVLREPVPVSTISGPLPRFSEPVGPEDLDADAEAFIAKMKADNDAWLAKVKEAQ